MAWWGRGQHGKEIAKPEQQLKPSLEVARDAAIGLLEAHYPQIKATSYQQMDRRYKESVAVQYMKETYKEVTGRELTETLGTPLIVASYQNVIGTLVMPVIEKFEKASPELAEKGEDLIGRYRRAMIYSIYGAASRTTFAAAEFRTEFIGRMGLLFRVEVGATSAVGSMAPTEECVRMVDSYAKEAGSPTAGAICADAGLLKSINEEIKKMNEESVAGQITAERARDVALIGIEGKYLQVLVFAIADTLKTSELRELCNAAARPVPHRDPRREEYPLRE